MGTRADCRSADRHASHVDIHGAANVEKAPGRWLVTLLVSSDCWTGSYVFASCHWEILACSFTRSHHTGRCPVFGGVRAHRYFVRHTWQGGDQSRFTNSNDAVTDTYEYDAFGNALVTTGSTPNNYLYRGEQFDPDLGLYYLRARYYNPATGRFMSRDPQEHKPITPLLYRSLNSRIAPLLYQSPDSRNPLDPRKLHKYVYTGRDPVNWIDPRGREGEEEDAELSEEAVDEAEQEEYQLKTLERYRVQQSWGVEEGESAEDAVPGNNINTTGSKQFVKMLYRSLEDWFSDDDE